MRIFILLSVFFFSLCMGAAGGYAQENAVEETPSLKERGAINSIALSFLGKKSGIETVGMSFFKTAGTQPDLREWAEKTTTTLNTPSYDLELVKTSEFNRLQNKFVNFAADEPIIIHAVVDMDSYSEKQGVLFLKHFHDQVYFPYDVYGMPVALLVRDAEMFREIPIDAREWEQISGKLEGAGRALVELTVLPVLADAQKTMRVDEKDKTEYYPLMVRPVQMALWTPGPSYFYPLWVWRASGYEPKQDRELLDLFKN